MAIRCGNVTSGAGKLAEAINALESAWDEAALRWKDGNSRSFEKNHLQPLQSDVRSALTAIRQMADVLNKVQRECEW